MTVLMHDCRAHYDQFPNDLKELLYADDTMLVLKDNKSASKLLKEIEIESNNVNYFPLCLLLTKAIL